MQAGRHANDAGVVIVETAIILPLFVLVLVGILEFGIVFHDYLILQNASREGARFAAVGNPSSAIEQRVRDFTFQLDGPDLEIDITNAQGSRGSTVVVRASYPVPLITPLMVALTGADAFRLAAESSMRLE